MASIKVNEHITIVEDNESLIQTCKNLGVPFACTSGVCGTCQVKVKKGHDNLTPLSEMEQELGMDEHRRLACQCRIKQGSVELEF